MERLEQLIARDPGRRGVGALVVPGDLAAAARVLARARRVLVLTGFAVGPDGVAETDGPPGALFLGRALQQRGSAVALATHRTCEPVVRGGLTALSLPAPLFTFGPGESADRLLAEFRPDAVVAIELPGRAADGEYYNMRGGRITARTAPLDGLLLAAKALSIATVGVGDGGNEAGMGKVLERVCAAVPGGERIGSVVPADCLIAAGTSNWGAYGLVAALDPVLLPAPEEEARLLGLLVLAGALDGVRLEAAATVDGIESGAYAEGLNNLREV